MTWHVEPCAIGDATASSDTFRLVAWSDRGCRVWPCCNHSHITPDSAANCQGAREQAARIMAMPETARREVSPRACVPARPWAWLVRILDALPDLFTLPLGLNGDWRWIRRARGGVWLKIEHKYIPGCPVLWWREEMVLTGMAPPGRWLVREEWP